jgi:hypothetical protein
MNTVTTGTPDGSRIPRSGSTASTCGSTKLLNPPATRVVVISPDQDLEDFLAVVEKMGLHRVSYAIGWTAWLDIAADGVNKATAMERVRIELGIPRERVMAVADGRNDIELLRWASESGRGVAMGQSPPEVIQAAREITGTVHEDGLRQVLASLQRPASHGRPSSCRAARFLRCARPRPAVAGVEHSSRSSAWRRRPRSHRAY